MNDFKFIIVKSFMFVDKWFYWDWKYVIFLGGLVVVLRDFVLNIYFKNFSIRIICCFSMIFLRFNVIFFKLVCIY